MMPIIVGFGIAAIGGFWYQIVRRHEVPAELDLEATHDHFHAHVSLDGYEVSPGDEVQVYNAPNQIPFGTKETYGTHATVHQASWLRRQLVKLTGGTDIQDLYDVGFEG